MKLVTDLPQVGFGSFSDRVIELCNHAFSPMYFHAIKKYWNNSMFAKVKSPCFLSDMDSGYFETYLPTFENVEANMNFYRIVIQVVPELSNELKYEYANSLKKPRIRPSGLIDSELIVLVSPTRTKKAKQEKQFINGYRQSSGVMVGAFLSKVPEIAMKNILIVIAKFLRTRLKKFIEAFKLNDWWEGTKGGWCDKYPLYYRSPIVNILEGISLSFGNAVKCICHLVRWIDKKIKDLLAEIGQQNMIQLAMKKIEELKPLLAEIMRFHRGFSDGNNMKRLLEPLLVTCQPNTRSGSHRLVDLKHHRWVDSRLPQGLPSG